MLKSITDTGRELLLVEAGSFCSGTADRPVGCKPSEVQLLETCVQICVTFERFPELQPNSEKISKMNNNGFISMNA